MSANKNRPHVLVLPEDDANREIALGFALELSAQVSRQFQVEIVAGGWRKVLQKFESDYVPSLNKFVLRYMVLLIDFDRQEERLDQVKGVVPSHLTDRVFVLGCFDEPETAIACAREAFGKTLALECREDRNSTWSSPPLQHNQPELQRMRNTVRPILFP